MTERRSERPRRREGNARRGVSGERLLGHAGETGCHARAGFAKRSDHCRCVFQTLSCLCRRPATWLGTWQTCLWICNMLPTVRVAIVSNYK